MNYTFQFWPVLRDFDLLLYGAWLTIRLSAVSMALGLVLATLFAWGKVDGPPVVRRLVSAYVEVIRNTPLLVQLFLIFLGLPSLGMSLSANQAALAAMVVNLTAYGAEIIRAGIESVPKGQVEAGRSLGLPRRVVFRRVVLYQALRAIYPALCSQFILVLLGSSVVSVIAAEDLTAVANLLQSRTFRSFEIYIVATLMYLAIALGFRGVFRVIQYAVFDRRGRA